MWRWKRWGAHDSQSAPSHVSAQLCVSAQTSPFLWPFVVLLRSCSSRSSSKHSYSAIILQHGAGFQETIVKDVDFVRKCTLTNLHYCVCAGSCPAPPSASPPLSVFLCLSLWFSLLLPGLKSTECPENYKPEWAVVYSYWNCNVTFYVVLWPIKEIYLIQY